MERIIKTVFNKEYFPADMQFMILTRDQEINRRKYSKGELVLIDMDNYKTIKSVTIQNTSPQNVFLEAFIEVRIKNLKTILSIKAKELGVSELIALLNVKEPPSSQIGKEAKIDAKTLTLTNNGQSAKINILKIKTGTALGELNLEKQNINPAEILRDKIEKLEFADTGHKQIILEILKLFEHSPPVMYKFNTLYADLFGFALPEHNLIVLHSDLADNPVALFHELMEYLIRNNKLELSIQENKLHIKIFPNGDKYTSAPRETIIGLKNTLFQLDNSGETWSKSPITSPHYLLRVFQRAVFNETDQNLTDTMKKKKKFTSSNKSRITIDTFPTSGIDFWENPIIGPELKKMAEDIKQNGLKNFKQNKEPQKRIFRDIFIYEKSGLPISIIKKPVRNSNLEDIKLFFKKNNKWCSPTFFVPGDDKYFYELNLEPFKYEIASSTLSSKKILPKNLINVMDKIEKIVFERETEIFEHGHLHPSNILLLLSDSGDIEDIKIIDWKYLKLILAKKIPITGNISIGFTDEEEKYIHQKINIQNTEVIDKNTDIIQLAGERVDSIKEKINYIYFLLKQHKITDEQILEFINILDDYKNKFKWFNTTIENEEKYFIGTKTALAVDIISFLSLYEKKHNLKNLIDEYILHELLENTDLTHKDIIKITTIFFGRGEYPSHGTTPLGRALREFINFKSVNGKIEALSNLKKNIKKYPTAIKQAEEILQNIIKVLPAPQDTDKIILDELVWWAMHIRSPSLLAEIIVYFKQDSNFTRVRLLYAEIEKRFAIKSADIKHIFKKAISLDKYIPHELTLDQNLINNKNITEQLDANWYVNSPFKEKYKSQLKERIEDIDAEILKNFLAVEITRRYPEEKFNILSVIIVGSSLYGLSGLPASDIDVLIITDNPLIDFVEHDLIIPRAPPSFLKNNKRGLFKAVDFSVRPKQYFEITKDKNDKKKEPKRSALATMVKGLGITVWGAPIENRTISKNNIMIYVKKISDVALEWIKPDNKYDKDAPLNKRYTKAYKRLWEAYIVLSQILPDIPLIENNNFMENLLDFYEGIIDENKLKEYFEFYYNVLMGDGKKDRGLFGKALDKLNNDLYEKEFTALFTDKINNIEKPVIPTIITPETNAKKEIDDSINSCKALLKDIRPGEYPTVILIPLTDKELTFETSQYSAINSSTRRNLLKKYGTNIFVMCYNPKSSEEELKNIVSLSANAQGFEQNAKSRIVIFSNDKKYNTIKSIVSNVFSEEKIAGIIKGEFFPRYTNDKFSVTRLAILGLGIAEWHRANSNGKENTRVIEAKLISLLRTITEDQANFDKYKDKNKMILDLLSGNLLLKITKINYSEIKTYVEAETRVLASL
ncbi:hypothetical protein OMAG_002194 [Candidatus Omnitrophus magneticus]|uniref:Uncharacterized protein n=1 Tax=Candidatus Omnitrophus magneticus TaxID=1609969 RepID=A0A0F0CPI4_9BACT|nr:hypothetical protein OMAG_002194 [Candidatus Omnitrophus magneticus]